ncbi:MAG: hypothetical protein JOY60_10755 [Burkholderiaceae bacterium]|nr:hypothetical protein [Burkholderiaceae bacterium]
MRRIWQFFIALLALTLMCSAGAAHALKAMDDESLSEVSAQDGISLMSNLNVNVGSFSYSTLSSENPTGGTLSFNHINIVGLLPLTVDLISSSSFSSAISAMASTYGSDGAAGLARFQASGAYDGKSDVLQLAVPNINATGNSGLSVSVNSVTLGNSSVPLTSLALSNLDLQGSRIWIWGR